jgi:hypothetical protein
MNRAAKTQALSLVLLAAWGCAFIPPANANQTEKKAAPLRDGNHEFHSVSSVAERRRHHACKGDRSQRRRALPDGLPMRRVPQADLR